MVPGYLLNYSSYSHPDPDHDPNTDAYLHSNCDLDSHTHVYHEPNTDDDLHHGSQLHTDNHTIRHSDSNPHGYGYTGFNLNTYRYSNIYSHLFAVYCALYGRFRIRNRLLDHQWAVASR